MSTSKRLTAFRRVETRVGDSLPAIAARELGDAALWPDLAAINGLLPPWITDDLGVASETVLLAGQQQIKLPTSSQAPSGVTDRDGLFGTDVALPGGRLQVTADGDLATVSDVANLTQALTMRLASVTGDLVHHPSYGCDVRKLIGQAANATTNKLAAVMVSRAVRSDARISEVASATGTVRGDIVTVQVKAVAVDGRRVSVGIPSGPGTPSSV